MKTKNICIVSNWSGFNYGAHLTHYALYRFLSDRGYSVRMLEKPDYEPFPPLCTPDLFKINPYGENALFPIFNSLSAMEETNNVCDTFIVGSDQLWNNELFGHSMEFYLLSFVESRCKKISYSTSLGAVPLELGDCQKGLMNVLLNRFDGVSVRESDGKEYLKDQFDINATLVLDPVFLNEAVVYKDLFKEDTFSPEIEAESYVFCYFIHPSRQKMEFANEIAKRKQKRIVFIGDALENSLNNNDINLDKNIKVEEWLSYIYYSDSVIADSFHALCFSLIFQKQVYSVFDSKKHANRIISLRKLLGIPEGIFFENSSVKEGLENIEKHKIDYGVVKNRLEEEIENSRSWLLHCLESEKNTNSDNLDEILVAYNVLYSREKEKEKKLHFLEEKYRSIDREADLEVYKKTIVELNHECEEERKKLLVSQKEIESIKLSLSFRIGSALLFVPKKIYALFHSK